MDLDLGKEVFEILDGCSKIKEDWEERCYLPWITISVTLCGHTLLPLQEGDHAADVLWERHIELWAVVTDSKSTVTGP